MKGYGTALVFEDNPLVAMAAEETLCAIGFDRVLAASSECAAVEIARDESLAFALVAVATFEAMGSRIAEQLARRCIPFAFSSDFADGSDVPAKWRDAPFVVRPYSERDLIALLQGCGF